MPHAKNNIQGEQSKQPTLQDSFKSMQFPIMNGRLKAGDDANNVSNTPKSIEEVDKSNTRSLDNGDHGYSNDMS